MGWVTGTQAGFREFVRQSQVGLSDRRVLVFCTLNAVDMLLTFQAMSMGGRELNFLYEAMGSQTAMAMAKVLLAGCVVSALIALKRLRLLGPLNVGMSLVVVWNLVAVLSWYAR